MACTKERASLINEFAVGKLSSEKSDELLDHVASCEACSAALEMVAGILACEAKYGAEVFEGRVSSLSVYWMRIKDGLRGVFTPRPFIRMAVPVAVAATIVLVLLNPFAPSPGEYARLARIEPYPYEPLSLRAGEDDEEYKKLFQEGMAFYSEGKYGDATRKLSHSVELKPDNAETQFFLGLSYLLENQNDKAIAHLQKAADLAPRPLAEKSHWYLGNTYLNVNDGAKALPEFEKVIQFNGRFQEASKGMIDKITKIRDERG